jgi:hypothetical protein
MTGDAANMNNNSGERATWGRGICVIFGHFCSAIYKGKDHGGPGPRGLDKGASCVRDGEGYDDIRYTGWYIYI